MQLCREQVNLQLLLAASGPCPVAVAPTPTLGKDTVTHCNEAIEIEEYHACGANRPFSGHRFSRDYSFHDEWSIFFLLVFYFGKLHDI